MGAIINAILEYVEKPNLEYWPYSNNIKYERYHDNNNLLHRSGDKPAVIEYYNTGDIKRQYWYEHGKLVTKS